MRQNYESRVGEQFCLEQFDNGFDGNRPRPRNLSKDARL